MGRFKRRGFDTITTKQGQSSTNGRKDTPRKSDGKRGKMKRLLSKPCNPLHKGLVLSPINESTCTDHRNVPTAATQRNRTLESKDAVAAPNSSTDDSSNFPEGVSSQLTDGTDSGDTSTSSVQSPEVFRRGDVYEEMVVFPREVLDLHVKNSTLLDVSHAENINMQQPPNLSSIVDISQMTQAIDQEISQLALPIRWTSSDKLFNSMEKTPLAERATVPSVPTKKRSGTVRPMKIKCRKRVTFSYPVAKKIEVKKVEAASRYTVSESTSETIVYCKAASLEEVSKVIKRNTHHSLEQAKFFDFADEKERETFVEMLRKKKSIMSSIFSLAGQLSTESFEEEGDMFDRSLS